MAAEVTYDSCGLETFALSGCWDSEGTEWSTVLEASAPTILSLSTLPLRTRMLHSSNVPKDSTMPEFLTFEHVTETNSFFVYSSIFHLTNSLIPTKFDI